MPESAEILAALRELHNSIERKWSLELGETEKRRANALSPRIEAALADAKRIIAKTEEEANA